MAKRKQNAWTKLVQKTYRAGRKRNSKYTFTRALSDAKKVYKKT